MAEGELGRRRTRHARRSRAPSSSLAFEQIAAGRREAQGRLRQSTRSSSRSWSSRARHVEVQILGDTARQRLVHLFERDCSMQRRNQKVVERAPAPYLKRCQVRAEHLCKRRGAPGQGRSATSNAGTVEFLLRQRQTDALYFIEVNPRIQVEHTVTEEVTGVDLVKAQIRIAVGRFASASRKAASRLARSAICSCTAVALQCRITTEDPLNKFIPDYGRITAYRGATGFGIRLDGGTAYSGAVITPFYDSLLEKVTAWAPTVRGGRLPDGPGAARVPHPRRGDQSLVSGEAGDRPSHVPDRGEATTLHRQRRPSSSSCLLRRDRATRLLTFIADVIWSTATRRSRAGRRPGAPGGQAPPEISPATGRAAGRQPAAPRRAGARGLREAGCWSRSGC